MESFAPVPVSQPSVSVLSLSFDEHGLLWLDSLKPRGLMQELLDEITARQEQTRIVWHKGTVTDFYIDSEVELKKAAGVFRLEHFKVWFERRNGRLKALRLHLPHQRKAARPRVVSVPPRSIRRPSRPRCGCAVVDGLR
jgi:hypothetical protein